MRASVKWGLIGGLVAGILLWGRYGEAMSIMYLVCLIFAALAGREAKGAPVLVVGAVSGALTAIVYHVAYYIGGTMDYMTRLGSLTGGGMAQLDLLGFAISRLPSLMVSPYTFGRIAIGILFGVIGAMIGRALTQAAQRAKTPVEPPNPEQPSDLG